MIARCRSALLVLCLACAPAATEPPAVGPPTTTKERPAPAVSEEFREREPTPGPEPRLAVPRVTSRKLPNGVRLLVARRTATSTTFRFDVPGFASSSVSSPALAEMQFALVTLRTRSHSSGEIRDLLDKHFAYYRSGENADATWFEVTMPAGRLTRDLIDVLRDVATEPVYEQVEVDAASKRRANLAESSASYPQNVCRATVLRAIFGDSHPYARGWYDASAHAGRTALVAAHGDACEPETTTVILAGAVTEQEEEDVATSFGAWVGHRRSRKPVSLPSLPKGSSFVVVDWPGAQQARLDIGCRAAARSSPDYFATALFWRILTGDTVGHVPRAIASLRAPWFASGVGRYEAMARDGALTWETTLDVTAVATAVELFDRELSGMRESEVTNDELERAKTQWIRGAQRFFATSRDLAAALSLISTYGLPETTWDKFADGVHAVTPADIKRIAQRCSHENAHTVVVGDWALMRGALAALGRGPIELRDQAGRPVKDRRP